MGKLLHDDLSVRALQNKLFQTKRKNSLLCMIAVCFGVALLVAAIAVLVCKHCGICCCHDEDCYDDDFCEDGCCCADDSDFVE